MSSIYVAVILLIIVALAVAIILIYRSSKGFMVTDYNITIEKSLTDSLHFVMISDLHDTDHGNKNEEVLKEIRKLNPEFVVFAGDMVTAYMELSYDYEGTLDFIGRLSKEYPIYYGFGNHEMRYKEKAFELPEKYERLESFMKENGVHFLDNEKISLDDVNADIYALTIPKEYYARFSKKQLPDDLITECIKDNDKSRVSILIAHNPDYFEAYAKWGADIVCSGHVHGGIVNLPGLGGVISPRFTLFPKYDAGIFKENGSTMILSRGLGYHTIPIRINNKAEICNITITSLNGH